MLNVSLSDIAIAAGLHSKAELQICIDTSLITPQQTEYTRNYKSIYYHSQVKTKQGEVMREMINNDCVIYMAKKAYHERKLREIMAARGKA